VRVCPWLLLQGLVFFLGREVPREQLLLVVRAFGGEAGWDGEGSPLSEGDERITHQVGVACWLAGCLADCTQRGFGAACRLLSALASLACLL
jgi:hypothetical protein